MEIRSGLLPEEPGTRRNMRHTTNLQPSEEPSRRQRPGRQGGRKYESDFIDDDEEEPVDDTDEDENWAPDDTDTD